MDGRKAQWLRVEGHQVVSTSVTCVRLTSGLLDGVSLSGAATYENWMSSSVSIN